MNRKKGIVSTPLNHGLQDKINLTSWTKERMPEYLWLGLILLYYGRQLGLEKATCIISEICDQMKTLNQPKLSLIFKLSSDEQNKVYEIIKRHVAKEVLNPLTLLFRNSEYPVFNHNFYVQNFLIQEKINIISEAVKLYIDHQSNESTDLRYLTILSLFFNKKLFISEGSDIVESIIEYPVTAHDNNKMRKHRPTIRSLEGISIEDNNYEFSNKFWRELGMLTPCKLMLIEYKENNEDKNELICESKKILEYVLCSNKEKSLAQDKFDIVLGSVAYALKIYIEIVEKALGNSILGRHGNRTIIEIYIILKYLLKKESENPRIWEEYKTYGISKYKLILLKVRETKLNTTSHFVPPIIDILVNEIKWEEFLDIDLKYFDKLGIREKSIEVNEKEMYDIFYDYDSSFTHGLWGAIRESSMLTCDNANHMYHSVPDINCKQLLPDVTLDSASIIRKIIFLLCNVYEVPKSLLSNTFKEK